MNTDRFPFPKIEVSRLEAPLKLGLRLVMGIKWGIGYVNLTYRFKIAVDDVLLLKQSQALEQRVGEPSDQVQAEALVIVLSN